MEVHLVLGQTTGSRCAKKFTGLRRGERIAEFDAWVRDGVE